MAGSAKHALSADHVIEMLGLAPHPEGGHYRETFRDADNKGNRSHSSAIYFLLQAGETSRWHRVDAAELWHWYAGAPLALSMAQEGEAPTVQLLGDGLEAGERPQAVVPQGTWQSARSLGEWSLIGCTVAPAFEFAGFELAPEGWRPDDAGA